MTRHLAWLVAIALAACGQSADPNGLGHGQSSGGKNASPDDPNSTGANADGTGASANGDIPRKTDYGEALRSASLKLVGELPTLDEIKAVGAAANDADKKKVFEASVDKYLADPRFSTQMLDYFRNGFKTGPDPGAAQTQGAPSMDSAATFAASVVVGDKSFMDILTATTGTCPTFANGTFTAGNCTTQAKVSGVLTDPGLMAQYTSNMAFRRVRFVQETFACNKFPAEVKGDGVPMGAGTYTSPWKFESITGGTSAKIDFHDTSAVICANCNTTMNHLAPLFANFDAKGAFQTAIQVQTPTTPPATTTPADWLPSGEGLGWRNGVAVTDIPSLGAAMAADPEVQRCAVTRVWNWALSRGDVVNDGANVPAEVVQTQVDAFSKGGFKLKAVIRSVFTSEDFVSY